VFHDRLLLAQMFQYIVIAVVCPVEIRGIQFPRDRILSAANRSEPDFSNWMQTKYLL
jgi:hypothetical protein